MYRKIQSQFPGKCSRCKTAHTAGTLVYWQKGTKGTVCVSCYESAGTLVRKEKPKGNIFTIEWRKLRKFVSDMVEGNSVDMKNTGNLRLARDHTSRVNNSFYGYTPIGLRTWIREGYTAKGLGELASPKFQDKRRYIYSEDADEIHIDRAISGEDVYRGEWTKEKRIPGVTLKIDIGFRGMVPADVVNRFNVWVSSVCRSLEDSGIDSQIVFTSTSTGTIPGIPESTVEVIVKRENEQADFKSFTPMLSPAAFRTFIFCARLLQAEENGVKCSEGMGSSVTNSWNVKFNPEHRAIEVTSYSSAYEFPEETMTLLFRKALEELRQAS